MQNWDAHYFVDKELLRFGQTTIVGDAPMFASEKDKPVVYETMGGELGPWLQAQHETHAGPQHIPPAGEGGGEYA